MELIERISVNAQSSIRIDAGKILRFDPLKIDGEPHDADVIFITHGHHDHFPVGDIGKVEKPETVFVAPKSLEEDLAKAGIPSQRTVFVRPDEKLAVSGFTVRALPAYNRHKPFHPRAAAWVGYLVEIEGKKVYVAGDTDGLDENVSIGADIAMIPIGGTFTMDSKAAAEFINKMKPEIAVPIHYGDMVGSSDDGKNFKAAVDGSIDVVFKL